jgi:hypothetical protein
VQGIVRAVLFCFALLLAGAACETRAEPASAHPAAASGTTAAPAPANAGSGGYILVPVAAAPIPVDASQKSDPWAAIAAVIAALSWPVVVLILAHWMLRAPQIEVLLTKLYQRTTQITIAGLEIKLSDGAAATLDDLQTLISKVPTTNQDWVSNTHLEDQFRYVIYDLRKYFCEANTEFSTPLSSDQFGELRFTLHVPDVLLAHSLRQLVNYVGASRGGAGRLFSARHGIIGLAWRLEESQHQQRAYSPDELVKIWGMTRAEAADTSSDKGLLLAFILKNAQGLPLAILYVDAESNTFLDPARVEPHTPGRAFELIESKVRHYSHERGLTASLESLEAARKKVKQLDVYQPSA